MRTISGKDAAGRGRDLEIMTLDVVSSSGRTTLSSVVCPKEQRTKPVDECVPCPDGRGPAKDPTSHPGYFSCVAADGERAPRESDSAADRVNVTAIMTRAVVAFCPDVLLETAREEMTDRELEAVPVVDRAGRPVGLLTTAELARARAAGATVGDAMQRRLFPVADTARLSDVAAVMASERVTSVPVVAREGQVVGLVAALDIVAWIAAQDDRGARWLP